MRYGETHGDYEAALVAQRSTGPDADDATVPGRSAGPSVTSAAREVSPQAPADATPGAGATGAAGADTDTELEEFFRQIFETSVDGMLLTAPDGRTFRANRAACELLGRSEAELQRLGRDGVLDSRQAPAAEMLASRRELGRVRREVSLIRGDGSSFPCEVSSSTYTNAQGEPRAVVILRDISVRRRAEEALLRREEQLRFALEGGDLGLWDWQAGTSVLQVNARWCEMLGLAPDGAPLTIDHWHSLVHPQDMPLLERLTEEVVLNPAGHNFETEIRARHRDGHYVWILDKGAVVERDERGRPVRIVGTHMDITARKAAEAQGREAEARLRFALDAAELGDWIIDLRTQVVVRSPQHDRCFGYAQPVTRWDSDTFLEHVHALDRSRVQGAYRSALAGLGDYDVEFRAVWPDRSVHWLWIKGRFYFDENGKPYRVAGIVADVSRRRRADELQREAATRLRLATEASNTGLWDWDLRTNDVYFSPTWKRQLGYADDEIDNGFDSWASRVHPDDVQRALATTDAYIKNPQPSYESEFRLRHRDGSYRWILSKASLIHDAEGRPVRLLGSHIDLTERKAAEAAILESEKRFRSAIEASPIPIALTDADEAIGYINPQFTRTLGYTLQDLRQVEDWWHLAYPDPDYRAWVVSTWEARVRDALASGGNPAPIEANVRCKDGSVRTVVGHAVRLNDAERPRRLVMFIDVTEQRLLERQVMEAVTREQQRLGMDIHDGLGQELTALSLLLTAAARTLSHADAESIERELMRLATVARHCLDIARAIAHGLSPIEPEHGGFERALERLAQTTARVGEVEVHLDLSGLAHSGDIEPSIAEPLFRIVQESMTNAVRHGNATRIDVRIERTRSQVRLSVSDNGTGMATAQSARGIGLRIMRYRAESIGGRLELDVGAGGGTVVRCVCPAHTFAVRGDG